VTAIDKVMLLFKIENAVEEISTVLWFSLCLVWHDCDEHIFF